MKSFQNISDLIESFEAGNPDPDMIELSGIVIPEGATIASLRTAGKYDLLPGYAEEYITDEHFKVTVTGPRRLYLACFNEEVVHDWHVKNVAKDKGFKLALIEDLLAVGSHPFCKQLQRQFSIVALGSTTAMEDDARGVPYLSAWKKERRLNIQPCWYGAKWGREFVFLFVK